MKNIREYSMDCSIPNTVTVDLESYIPITLVLCNTHVESMYTGFPDSISVISILTS